MTLNKLRVDGYWETKISVNIYVPEQSRYALQKYKGKEKMRINLNES